MKTLVLGKLFFFSGQSDRVVASRADREWHEADFLQQLDRLVYALRLQPGTSCLLYVEDSALFALAFLALLCSKKCIVLAPNRQAGLLAQLARDCDQVLSDQPVLPQAMLIQDLIASSQATGAFDAKTVLDTDACITIVTSGSTGEPKRIDKPLHTLVAELEMLETLWGSTLGSATIFATVTHQHIYGLLFRVLWPISKGRIFRADTHAYPESLFADMLAQAMKTKNRCVLVSSPAHLKRIPEAIDGNAVRPRLVRVFSSGGPLAAEDAVQFAARFGATPTEVFGSTEMGGIACRQQQRVGASTPWQLMPGVEMRCDNETQCLAVRSPYCYQSGWYDTSDRIEIKDNNFFYHLGRVDRVVKLEEKRVSLTAMEESLKQFPGVVDARVILLSAASARQQLGAVIVLDASHALPAETARREMNENLRKHLLSMFERSLLPRKWRYMHTLPMNSQGKTTQHDLLALFYMQDLEEAQVYRVFPDRDIHSIATVISKSDTSLQVRMDTTQQPWVFDGHFDAMPILPGVLQMDWVVRLAQKHWYPEGKFFSVSRIKFQCPIEPGDVLDIALTHDGRGKVQYCYECSGREMSSGSFVLRTASTVAGVST